MTTPVGGLQFSRRQFVQSAGAVGAGLLAGCGRLPWQAAPPVKVPRLGILMAGSRESRAAELRAFSQGLADLGYDEGRNILVEYRFAERVPDLAEAAAGLIRLPVDVLVVPAEPPARAAQETSSTTPIVMAASVDPVGLGIVASLAQPGGNVTGLATLDQDLAGKRLELLKEAVPSIGRVTFLATVGSPHHPLYVGAMQTAAGALGVQLDVIETRTPSDLEGALEAMARERPAAVIPMESPLNAAHSAQIIAFAAQHRLPAVYATRAWVELGGLMAYGPNFPNLWRRAATYVDKLLKGARPATLPVEQAREFEFVINLTMAQTLGLTIPPHVLLQATEVIQ
jgi:putative tryptophan/tyrosine transport system substrate-binding protein